MAHRHLTLITRRKGTLVEADRASTSSPRQVSLAIYLDEPGSSTVVLADTWATVPTGSPTVGYDFNNATVSYDATVPQPSAYIINAIGEAAILALLVTGYRYRFEWRWMHQGILQREQKTFTWQTEPSSSFPVDRAIVAPLRFSPTVNGVSAELDTVTLNGTSRVRAGLLLNNTTTTIGTDDIVSWNECDTTKTPTAYDVAAVYAVGDLVNDGSVTYVCIASISGSLPSSTPANFTAISTLVLSGNSIPTYDVVKIREGLYGFSAANTASIAALLKNSSQYDSKWTFVCNGISYSSSLSFVHQDPNRIRSREQRYFKKNFGQLKKIVTNFLGSEPGTTTSDDMVNHATLAFFQQAPWAFSESDTVYLDINKDSKFVDFPEDFASKKVIGKSGDSIHNFIGVNAIDIASLREKNLVSTSNTTYYYIRSNSPTDDQTEVRTVMEIYPTFSSTIPGGIRLDYMRIPPLMVDDNDVPPVPINALVAYIQFLRYWAADQENEESAPDEEKKWMRIVERAVLADENRANPHIGRMSPVFDNTGSGGYSSSYYLPTDPEQGPIY